MFKRIIGKFMDRLEQIRQDRIYRQWYKTPRRWRAHRCGGGAVYETPPLNYLALCDYMDRRGVTIVHIDVENAFVFFADSNSPGFGR